MEEFMRNVWCAQIVYNNGTRLFPVRAESKDILLTAIEGIYGTDLFSFLQSPLNTPRYLQSSGRVLVRNWKVCMGKGGEDNTIHDTEFTSILQHHDFAN